MRFEDAGFQLFGVFVLYCFCLVLSFRLWQDSRCLTASVIVGQFFVRFDEQPVFSAVQRFLWFLTVAIALTIILFRHAFHHVFSLDDE